MTQSNTDGLPGENLPDGSLSPEQLQQILQVGQMASEQLNNPVFNMAYQNLMTALHGQWLSTEDKEERKRESIWMQAKGLEKVTRLLGSAVEDAQRVLAEQAQQNDPNVKYTDHLDQQGFGVNYN